MKSMHMSILMSKFVNLFTITLNTVAESGTGHRQSQHQYDISNNFTGPTIMENDDT